MKDWLSHLALIKGREIELQIQGVNAGKAFTSQRRVCDTSANSGVKVLMIKCTQDQITCRRCLVVCLDFAKEELH